MMWKNWDLKKNKTKFLLFKSPKGWGLSVFIRPPYSAPPVILANLLYKSSSVCTKKVKFFFYKKKRFTINVFNFFILLGKWLMSKLWTESIQMEDENDCRKIFSYQNVTSTIMIVMLWYKYTRICRPVYFRLPIFPIIQKGKLYFLERSNKCRLLWRSIYICTSCFLS